jgi:hypothetical protein
VPIAIHEGFTTDISKFRFVFWEAVWYYEPTARYPEPNMLPGCFVGLANSVGDAFTYKIWMTPNGNWEDGLELVRNIVKSRDDTDVLPKRDDSIYDAFDLKKKESHKKKKNRKRKAKAILESVTVANVPQAKERYSAVKFNLTPQVRETESMTPEEQGEEEESLEQPSNRNNYSNQPNFKMPTKDKSETVEMSNKVNDEYEVREQEPSGSRAMQIRDHRWKAGLLEFKVWWDAEESSWETLADMKEDHPKMTATYIVDNNATRSTRVDCTLQWAKKTLRDIKRFVDCTNFILMKMMKSTLPGGPATRRRRILTSRCRFSSMVSKYRGMSKPLSDLMVSTGTLSGKMQSTRK